MNKIAFLCDWGETSEAILARYARQTPGGSGVWKDLKGVSDPSNADIVIVLGGTEHKLDRSRSILVIREPDFIRVPKTDNFDHIIRWQETHCGITWWLSNTYDELISMSAPKKLPKVSCITSNKHSHRNTFLSRLVLGEPSTPQNQNKLIDLYGRGHSQKTYGNIYKGSIETNGNCKLDGLLKYQYSLVLENSVQTNYWTEKLADVILAWCFPIYWGCPNVHDFFDQSCIFSIGSESNYTDILQITQEPISSSMVSNLADARLKILNQYNIWETISQKMKTTFKY